MKVSLEPNKKIFIRNMFSSELIQTEKILIEEKVNKNKSNLPIVDQALRNNYSN